jgi:uncharacterized protein (TIGR02588 family)
MSKKQKSKLVPRTTAEWVSLAISLLLLSAVVAPRFQVERGRARNEAGQFYLDITVTNEGDATGAQVAVEGKLGAGDAEEISMTTFDFIPGRSRVGGVLIFSGDPAEASVRVISYQQP